MNNLYIYIIIGLVILYFLNNQTIENFQNMKILPISLDKKSYRKNIDTPWLSWPQWWPWNQPTRFPKLYYDIRGDPNIAYRQYVFGGYIPYGYVFGPYLYDPQGNLIYDSNKPHYIA
jgi:hypothetical protein